MGVGVCLSLSGMILQVLFSNPLCEPYSTGLSSGASLAAVISFSLGMGRLWNGIAIPAALGALLVSVILVLLARRGMSSTSLLLSGVMLSFLGSSGVALWMALTDQNGIQGALFWLLGDLSRAEMKGSVAVIAVAFLGWITCYRYHRELDGFLGGEFDAQCLGIDVKKVRFIFLILVSLLVGVAVSAAGMIGFVGLVVPHLTRRLTGTLHKKVLMVLPAMGASLVLVSDFAMRVLADPHEIPVGVVTAMVGAPIFLILLQNGRRGARGSH